MRYPVAIEPGTDAAAFGIVVPDLPGCFSAGDTLGEALDGAKEAVLAWVEAATQSGEPIPPPTSLERVSNDPEFEGWVFGFVTLEGKASEPLDSGTSRAA